MLMRKAILMGLIAILSAAACLAQFRRAGRRGFWGGSSGPIVQTEGGEMVNEDTVRTARETTPHSIEFPAWTNSSGFPGDTFTFARLIYHSLPGRPSWLGWVNDYPDGDLNLSYRLQQLTSMRVDPDGRVLRLTDPDLHHFPLVFAAQAGGMDLTEAEIEALRRYLKSGGVLWVDDFWGDEDWANFEFQLSRVLPGQRWIELPADHPIFHCVFPLKGDKNQLQVPTIQMWRRSYDPENPQSFASAFRGEGSREMHVRAWLDERGRIQVLALHNTDTGDGWEREGENPDYFRQFSETRAYPLAINIIFYIMTH